MMGGEPRILIVGGGPPRMSPFPGQEEKEEPVHVDVVRCPVCLVRTGGAVYALRGECTHQAVPLSAGDVVGRAIECWLHGSRFDLATGQVLSPPATRPVAIYGVRTEGEDVFVHLGKGEGDSVSG